MLYRSSLAYTRKSLEMSVISRLKWFSSSRMKKRLRILSSWRDLVAEGSFVHSNLFVFAFILYLVFSRFTWWFMLFPFSNDPAPLNIFLVFSVPCIALLWWHFRSHSILSALSQSTQLVIICRYAEPSSSYLLTVYCVRGVTGIGENEYCCIRQWCCIVRFLKNGLQGGSSDSTTDCRVRPIIVSYMRLMCSRIRCVYLIDFRFDWISKCSFRCFYLWISVDIMGACPSNDSTTRVVSNIPVIVICVHNDFLSSNRIVSPCIRLFLFLCFFLW